MYLFGVAAETAPRRAWSGNRGSGVRVLQRVCVCGGSRTRNEWMEKQPKEQGEKMRKGKKKKERESGRYFTKGDGLSIARIGFGSQPLFEMQ